MQCKYCREETRSEGTEMCDNCWEIKTRIGYAGIAVLHKIADDVFPQYSLNFALKVTPK